MQGRATQEEVMMNAPVFVGIDVSQAQLDIALRPAGRFTAPNDDAGIAKVVDQLRAVTPTVVLLEATGGLELPLVGALAAAALPVVVVNPRQVRDFAKAAGQLAKTDALDAQILAHFAEVMRPAPRPLPDEQTHEIGRASCRERQLVEMLTAEKNRLASARKPVRKSLQAHITWLERELTRTDTDLAQAIRESPVWREKEELLGSAPGLGAGLTTAVLANRPEPRTFNVKQTPALRRGAP